MFKWLYFAFFMLFPFYIFDSGVPQFSHMILAVSMLLVIIYMFDKLKHEIYTYPEAKNFLIYVILVNFIWFIYLLKFSLLVYTLYYIFSVLLFYTTMVLIKNNKIDYKFILNSMFITVLLQMIIAFTYFELTLLKRNYIFFNNPNQLGYFALALATIFYIVENNILINKNKLYDAIFSFSFYIICLILIIISTSNAAFISYLFLLILVIKNKFNYKKIMLFIIIIIGIISLNTDNINNLIENSTKDNRRVNLIGRIMTINERAGSSLAGRGYDRIVYHREYVLFGAGEGDFKRFVSQHKGELHSIVGNILFSYGVIGLALFLLIIFRRDYKTFQILIYMSPLLLYSLTHNSIRSPLFWIALAISIIFSKKEPIKSV